MKLKEISKYVQRISENIAKVINVDVTVVDLDRTRIAGTGRFVLKIGSKIDKSSFYNEVMKSGKHSIIRGKCFSKQCEECSQKSTCEEILDICCPIKRGNSVIGVIGMVAFNEAQKNNLICKQDELIDFIYTMSELLVSKLSLNRENTNVTPKFRIPITFDSIIGNNENMIKAKVKAHKASQSCSNILITGESGTGKEIFAQAIHNASSRRNNKFVAINCAAIPEGLLESELFGYEDGAFTGAKSKGKAGKFQSASGGTIFLDEIGDMPKLLQSKLLRVIQERYIERVGGNKIIPIDVHIIAATHKNLENLVKEGKFRKDLFYRLNVIPICIPPLRDRKDDIILLMNHLLKKCDQKLGKNITGFSKAVIKGFENYNWEGNVRELQNVIEYAVNMESGNIISLESIPEKIKSSLIKKRNNGINIRFIKQLEKEEIMKALNYFGYNTEGVKKSAEALNIGVATLYRKIKKYDICN